MAILLQTARLYNIKTASYKNNKINSSIMDKKGFIALQKAGFTMTEVIVAVLIMAILSAGVFSAFWGAQYFLNRARHKVQAYNFAIEALDRLRSNYQYSSSPAMDIGADHAETEIEPLGILRGELTSFNGALTYDVAEPESNAYKEVTISVNWNEPS